VLALSLVDVVTDWQEGSELLADLLDRPGADELDEVAGRLRVWSAYWWGRAWGRAARGRDDRSASPARRGAPASEGADDAQRLRELGERYFWLFEDSPVAKYVCDVEGTVLEVNAALCRMLCMRPDDLVGRTLASFSVDRPCPPPSWSRSFAAPCGRTRESGRTARPTVGRGGGRHLGAIRDENGAARTIFGELEDLTVHELALSELDRQRHRLEMAIEASNIAVWELDVVSGRVTVQDRPPGAALSASRT